MIPDGMALVPHTGELVDLSNAAAVAKAAHQVKTLETQLRDARRDLEWALIEESKRQGTKTLHLGGYTAKIEGGDELQWDLEILAELIDAGLPQERYDDLVTEHVQYKVSSTVARQLEGASEVYAEIVGRARSRFPKQPRVNVKEGG